MTSHRVSLRLAVCPITRSAAKVLSITLSHGSPSQATHAPRPTLAAHVLLIADGFDLGNDHIAFMIEYHESVSVKLSG